MSSKETRPKPRLSLAGYGAREISLAAAAVAVTLWGVWVSKEISGTRDDQIVQVQLQALIGDYLQAQARSNASDEQSAASTVAYVKAVEAEMAALGASGKIVLVSNAVAGGDVEDVTQSIRARALERLSLAGLQHPQGADASVRTAMREYLVEGGNRQ